MSLDQVEIWSDIEANDGERLEVITDYEAVLENMELGRKGRFGREELVVVIAST